MSPTGLLPNLYCIGLGKSLAGKNAPINVIEKNDGKFEGPNLIIPGTVTSDGSLIRHLVQQNRKLMLMFTDEIGHVMKGCKTDKAAHGIPRLLMDLFSATKRSVSKTCVTTPVMAFWRLV
jgi:hypothetical protein